MFVTQGDAKAASEQTLPVVNINTADIISHRMVQAERYQYQCVQAYWYDVETATRHAVTAGNGKPVYVLAKTYTDAGEALHATQAKLDAFKRGMGRLSLDLIGQPDLQVASKITLTELREPIDGQWLITRVVHQLNAEGLITQIEAEMPNT